MRNCGKSLQVPWLLSKRAHSATRRDYGLGSWTTAQQESVPRPPGLAFLTVGSRAGVPSPRSTIKACINCLCRPPPPRLWPIRTEQTHPSAIGTGERRGHVKNHQSDLIAPKRVRYQPQSPYYYRQIQPFSPNHDWIRHLNRTRSILAPRRLPPPI